MRFCLFTLPSPGRGVAAPEPAANGVANERATLSPDTLEAAVVCVGRAREPETPGREDEGCDAEAEAEAEADAWVGVVAACRRAFTLYAVTVEEDAELIGGVLLR